MKLIYYYSDGFEKTVTGKSERECAIKMKQTFDEKLSRGINLIRVERPRTMLEIVTG